MNEIKSAFKESSAYLFTKNPVLVLGLVIGQLAAGVSNLQNAAALSVTYFFVVSGVLVFASLFGKKLPGWLKVVLYAIVGSLMLVPSYFISAGISATIFDSVGIYPALLAVSTVPIVYSEKIAENKKPISALVNGICIAFGFAITAFILGAAREILGSGSLFGFKVVKSVFPAAKLPFWGFIFLGFMAALVNFIKEFIKKPTGEEEKE
jgi:electron transport complex protein RnfE